jgi:hypothetical protein
MNLLKPAGYMMHQQFNIQQLYALPTLHLFILHLSRNNLQWYGHVKLMPEERVTKLVMEWIPLERRKRGRPRKTWMDGIQAAMTTRILEPYQWRNREEWRLVSGRRRQLL